MVINKEQYSAVIQQDIDYMLKLPQCLEREHIIEVLKEFDKLKNK